MISGQRYKSKKLLFTLVAAFFVTDITAGASELGQKPKRKKPTLYIEELNLQTYENKVLKVANGSVAKPGYHPIVFYHIPWCQDCKIATPEFVIAAGNIAQAVQDGHFKHFPAAPRFFMFSCEAEEVRVHCDHHAGRHFPAMSAFRDSRIVRFNRPKKADVITWWSHRISRSALSRVDTEDHVKGYTKQEVAFLVAADPGVHDPLLEAWHNIALENLDRFVFLITSSTSPLAEDMGPPPAVTVRAPPGLTMRPTKLQTVRPNRTEMYDWVNYNQFPVVTVITPWTLHELKYSEHYVVVLAHGSGTHGAKLKKRWEKKVLDLRPTAKYLWAALNVSAEDSSELMANNFPVIATDASELPAIFAFTGEGGSFRYWENPVLTSIENLTIDNISALLISNEALQEDSTVSWMKEKRKIYIRFSQRSKSSFAIAVTIPLAILTCCWFCCKGACNDDGTEPEWLKERLRERAERESSGVGVAAGGDGKHLAEDNNSAESSCSAGSKDAAEKKAD